MRTSARRATPARLTCEMLEDRLTPALAYALDAGGVLYSFDTATPAATTSLGVVGGVTAGETLVGLDARPATGQLYTIGFNAAGTAGTLYTIAITGGAATATRVGASSGLIVPTGTAAPTATGGFGFDFNPTVDRIRLVTTGGQSFVVDPTTGALFNQQPTLNGGAATASASGYTNNFSGATATTLYALDASGAADTLYIQVPGTSVLTPVGALGIDSTNFNGFDIPVGVNVATSGVAAAGNGFLAARVGATTNLYTVNLTTGVASAAIGTIATANPDVVGFTLALDVIQVQSATVSGTEGTAGINVVLTRTGDTAVAATATVTATGGTATAGDDYAAGPFVVTFAPGATTATLNIPFFNDAVAEGPETLVLTITGVTGGAPAVAGAVATTTLTVTDTPQRFGQVFGTASGAPLVAIVPSGSTTPTTFNPYQGVFTSGGVRVAVGDVTGDGIDDLVTINSVGAPLVRVFSGATGNQVTSFQAYPQSINIPASLAVGDVNGDGFDDIILSTTTTIAAVIVYSGRDFSQLKVFFPGDGALRLGFNVTSGDFNGDGFDDIILGTTTGLSVIAAFSGTDNSLLTVFLPFGNLSLGTTLSAGDLDGDGKLDILAGTNSVIPAVVIFNGQNPTTQATVFFPFGSATGGASTAVADVNGDGKLDIVVGPTLGVANTRALDGRTLAQLNLISPFGNLGGGVFVG